MTSPTPRSPLRASLKWVLLIVVMTMGKTIANDEFTHGGSIDS